MANSSQARKRARQNDTRRARNQSQAAAMRTAVKRFLQVLRGADTTRETATAAYKKAASSLDRMARKGRQHKNKAARLKSRLNKRLHHAEFTQPTAPAAPAATVAAAETAAVADSESPQAS